jgi:hypothetical protein
MHLPCRVGGQASASEEDCERGVAVARGGGASLEDRKTTVSRNRPGPSALSFSNGCARAAHKLNDIG